MWTCERCNKPVPDHKFECPCERPKDCSCGLYCCQCVGPGKIPPQTALKYIDGKLVEVEHKTVFGLLVSVGGLGA